MKKLVILTVAIALASIRLHATSFIFDPNFSNQTGYTTVTSGGGTTSYSGDVMTDGDASNAVSAYATGSGTDHGGTTFYSQFTFTPTFTATPTFADDEPPGVTYSGNYEAIPLLTIAGTQGNNALLKVQLDVSTYNNDDQIGVSSGLQFGGGVQTGPGATVANPAGNPTTNYYAPGNINSLSGQTLTFRDTLTVDNSNEDMTTFAGFVLTNHATLSNSQGQVLFTYDYTQTSRAENTTGPDYVFDILGSGYDPAYDTFTASVGDLGNSAPASYDNGMPTGDNFLESPATVSISDVSVVATPEPSTYAMMFAGFVLLLATLRRRIIG